MPRDDENGPVRGPDYDWPTRSFEHGDRKFIYPSNAAESDRVLEAAYQAWRNEQLSYDEYTKQKAICHKAKCNDGGGLLGMLGQINPVIGLLTGAFKKKQG